MSAQFIVTLACVITLLAAVIVIIAPRKTRHVPGLPDDGDPLACHEWDEMDLIEEFYGTDAAEPARRRRTWGRQP